MAEKIKELKKEFYINSIKALMKANNGYVTSKQVTELGIHRMYLNMMVEEGLIDRVKKGIYLDKDFIEDIFYTFQLKYPKTIFSRFTALYFYNLTEIYPSTFDITVNENYHTEDLNVNHNVVKCKKDNLNLGLTQIITSLGNKINIYDRERCICDIIRFKNRLDLEQVKKSVKMYVKDNNKDLNKLSEYSKKLNIYNEVMEFIGMYYE